MTIDYTSLKNWPFEDIEQHYLRYKVSLRDLVEMMAERYLSRVPAPKEVPLGDTTILRWVKRYTLELVRRWNRFGTHAGVSWHVDETYLKIRDKWVYLCRALDRAGQKVDFLLRLKHDAKAAKAFSSKANRHRVKPPKTVTLDGYAASYRAVRKMKIDGLLPKDTKVQSSKYLNKLIEPDHRFIKSRSNVMRGFKRFTVAANTFAGFELMHSIRKGQFSLAKLGFKDTTAPVVGGLVRSIRSTSYMNYIFQTVYSHQSHGYHGKIVTFGDRKIACTDAGDSGSTNPIQSHAFESWTLRVRRGLATGRFARNIFFPPRGRYVARVSK
jgi:transposase-like protein